MPLYAKYIYILTGYTMMYHTWKSNKKFPLVLSQVLYVQMVAILASEGAQGASIS